MSIYIAIYLWLKDGQYPREQSCLFSFISGSVFGSVWDLGKAITKFSEALAALQKWSGYETVPSVIDNRICAPWRDNKEEYSF